MTDHLLVKKQGGIARITFNRPEAKNAVSLDMRDALIDAMLEIEKDESVRCVVLRGNGGTFVAGGDIKGFAELAKLPPQERHDHFAERILVIQPLLLCMQRMDKPVIAVVEGAAVGFGFSLAMAADLVIAEENAKLGSSYVKLGISLDGAGSYYLPKLIGMKKAMELAMLGEFIDAKEAQSLGLVNRVVTKENLEAEAEKLIQRLANAPTMALGRIKRQLYASEDNSLKEQMDLEAKFFGECTATEDWVEGVTAFTEKRKPSYKGK